VKQLGHVAFAFAFASPFCCAQPCCAQLPDAKDLIRRSIQNYDKDWRARMNWSYTETDVTCTDGKKEVDVSTIMPLEGTPYERLISRDSRALSSDEQHREDEKFNKELRRRQSETPAERQARLQKFEKERSFLVDLPAAYTFKVTGEDVVDGRSAWVVSVTPRPGFVPTTPHAGLLKHIGGKLWIDKTDLHWARAEADVIEPVSIGLIVARIAQGAHIYLDFDRISDSLWVPKNITVKGAAKILLIHTKELDEEISFSDYHAPGKINPALQVATRQVSPIKR
jgi:hypothetical protein